MNRKTRRAKKIKAPPAKHYAVTYSGATPDELSPKERSIVLAMTSQVPFAAGIMSGDVDFTFDDLHMHVLLKGDRRVCLRWQETDVAGVFEGTCEKLTASG